MMVEGRRRLAGFSVLAPTDASETCSVALLSGERALLFVLRFAVDLVDPFFCRAFYQFLIREG